MRWIWLCHGLAGGVALLLLAHGVRGLDRRLLRAATALLTAVFVVGCLTYPTFRVDVRADLLARQDRWIEVFESKEHIAAVALALVWGGTMAVERGGDLAFVRRSATVALVLGGLVTALTLAMGVAFVGHTRGWY